MATTKSRVLESAPQFSGQKSGLPPKTLKSTDCETISNMLLSRGTLVKVNGQSVYATLAAASGAIQWIDQYKYRLMLQRNSSIYLETAEDSASFTEISSTFNSAKIFSKNYRGSIFMVNGVDEKFYTISDPASALSINMRQLGVYPPTTALSSSGVTRVAGGVLGDGTFRYVITFYDPVTNTESPACGARSGEQGLFNSLDPVATAATDYFAPVYMEKATGAASSKISIPFANMTDVIGTSLAADERRTHFIVYRTEINGVVFKRQAVPQSIATFLAGAAAYLDNTPDTELGAILKTDVSPPPLKSEMQTTFTYLNSVAASPQSTPSDSAYSGYTHITFFNDTMFAVGAKNPGIITNSQLSSFQRFDSILYIHDPFIPDYVLDTREVGPGDGQSMTGVAVLRDQVVIVLKQRSLYYVSGTNVDNYVVRVMDSRRGCVHASSIQETPFGVFALDHTGVIQIDQVGPAKIISEEIEDVIRSINFSAISTCYSGFDSQENRYWLAVPVEGSTRPNKTLIYDVKTQGWSVASGGEGYSMLFCTNSDNTEKHIIGSYSNGRLLSFSDETVVTFNGAIITSEYLSGPFYGGDPTRKKKAKFVYITAESNTDWDFDLDVVPDFGQNETFSLTNLNSSSLYSVWAASLADSGALVGVFDESLFSAAKVRKQVKIPVSCIGYGFQIRITNRSTDSDQYGFRILALELECVMMGK